MGITDKIWNAEKCRQLNLSQHSGEFHPFTCGGDRTDDKHLDGEGVLVATEYR